MNRHLKCIKCGGAIVCGEAKCELQISASSRVLTELVETGLHLGLTVTELTITLESYLQTRGVKIEE